MARARRSWLSAATVILTVLIAVVTPVASASAATTTASPNALRTATASVAAAAVALAPTTPAKPDYRSLQPARLADTRAGYATIDGRAQGTGKVSPGAPLLVPIAGRAGVPAAGQVVAVALNVTAVDSASGGSWLTVYPANEARPLASNLNVEVSEAVANSVIAKLSPAGEIRIYVKTSMHIIVDVAGYWTTGGIVPLSPARLADSRPGEPTVDGQFAGTGKVAGGSAMQVKVTGRGGVASTATSVALNVVVTGSSNAGFLTAFATGKPLPLASNLNYVVGATTANQIIAPVGTGGQVSLFVSASADVVVDVAGYFSAGSGYVGLAPARVADTRSTGQTVPGPTGLTERDSSKTGPVGRTQVYSQLDVLVYGRAGLPSGGKVGAVVVNVTVTNPSAVGYLSVFPTGSQPPNASNVNVVAGQTRPNLVIAKVGRGGSISLITSIPSTDLIVDVMGYLPAVSPAAQLPYYDWIDTGFDGAPSSFDRCYPIYYQYSLVGEPVGARRTSMVADVEAAIGRIEAVTGLNFVNLGNTADSPDRDAVDADGFAQPVIIGFGNEAQFPFLAGDVVGYAGPYSFASWDEVRFGAPEYLGGSAIFDSADGLIPGFGTGDTFGKVALHELGHVLGLGHVDNAAEVMNPYLVLETVGEYGAGDTLGLRVLYQTQDCPGSVGSFERSRSGVRVPDFGTRDDGVIQLP